MKKINRQPKKSGMRIISLYLSDEDLAFLDREAKKNARTRAGQARFFLSSCRSTAGHA